MDNIKNSIPPIRGWVSNSKKPYKIVGIIALAVIICLVLVITQACSSNKTTEPPVSESPLPTNEEQPVYGSSISIPVYGTVETYNPLKAMTADLISIGWLSYESLLKYDSQGRIVNGLCEDYNSDDNKTWTLKIKKGVKWHNGGELTANDILYTYELIKDYSSDECKYTKDVVSTIEKIEVVNDYSITVTAKESGNAVFDALMFPILSKSYCSTRNIDNALPHGTGPFYADSKDSDGMILKANENWWKQRPYLNSIKVTKVTDEDNALKLFDKGKLSVVPIKEASTQRLEYNENVNLSDIPTNYYECLVPNHYSTKLASVKMRKAIAYSLDTQKIIERAYVGDAIAVETPVSPHSYLFDATLDTYEYKPVLANDMLDETGWTLKEQSDGTVDTIRTNGSGAKLSLRLLVYNNPKNTIRKDAADTIKSQLEEVGIEVNVVLKDWDEYLEALDKGTFDLAICGFNLNGSFDLREILDSSGSINYANYGSMSMNSALDSTVKETDYTKRQLAHSELQQIILNELPIISVCFREYCLVSDISVQGIGGISYLNYYDGVEGWYISSE